MSDPVWDDPDNRVKCQECGQDDLTVRTMRAHRERWQHDCFRVESADGIWENVKWLR